MKTLLFVLMATLSVHLFAFEGNLLSTGNLGYENALVELEPKSNDDGRLIFTMYVNTHSVSFEYFDLQSSTFLEVNGKTYTPSSVPTLYSHHNEGDLIFDIGEAVSTDVKITIENMAGEEKREFVWPLNP